MLPPARAASRALSALAIVVLLAALPSPAAAVQLGNPDDILSLEVHFFGSQGFMYSTSNNYLAHTTTGSFEFTEVGLNFTKQLTDKLRAGFQLFARKLGATGDFSIKADWFYLDYRWKDWLGFRAGRLKLPFGLYNDSSDIDAARAPVLLPQSVYPTQDRDFLLAQTGAELYGYLPMHKAGQIEYRIYGGTIFLDIPAQPGAVAQVTNLRIPYIVGGRLMWETPLDGLRMGGSFQALRLDTTLLVNPAPPLAATLVNDNILALIWVASLEYAAHRMLFAAEYSRWRLATMSNNAMLAPSFTQTQERFYAMAAYRVNRWFQPSLYYSGYFPSVDARSGRANYQHDVAASFRFDINSFWIVKLEGHFMDGTAVLDPTLNGNAPLATLDRLWGFFLAKTTVYF